MDVFVSSSNLAEDAEAVAELIGSAAYHAATDAEMPRRNPRIFPRFHDYR
jgi:hypothetical protein